MEPQSLCKYLHDEYYILSSGQVETKYDRLTAVVRTILQNQDSLSFEIELWEYNERNHQMFGWVDRKGDRHRFFIDCEDLDIPGEPLGLERIYNAQKVAISLGSTECFVISCNRFSVEARMYARAKGIALVVLSNAHDAASSRMIEKTGVSIHACLMVNPALTLDFTSDESIPQYLSALQEMGLSPEGGTDDVPMRFYEGGRCFTFTELVQHITRGKVLGSTEDLVKVLYQLDRGMVQVGEHEPMGIDSVEVSFLRGLEKRHFWIGALAIASLISQGYEEDDIIFFEHEIQRGLIDESTGNIMWNQ